MFGFFSRAQRIREIAPDEIFLDSTNLPQFDAGQFEGRVERALNRRAILAVGICFSIIALVFGYRAFALQVNQGAEYAGISLNNTLERQVIFATRGLIYDRTGAEVAWNEAVISTTSAQTNTFPLRVYTKSPGLAHILGFVLYPKADAKGEWWREDYSGASGVELAFDSALAGVNGSTMVESDALGNVERENIVSPPRMGNDLHLAVDAEVQSELHSTLAAHASRMGFRGGAAIIMDVRTGELIALTSFPEYDNQAFTDGVTDTVKDTTEDARSPQLNRAVSGLYTPGSILKPMFAAAALKEGIITAEKEILSTGAISLPNPYNPSAPSIFRDWTVHGLVDMRTAIAVSSDEYFYTIGGGYGGQRGLGIAKLDEYARLFGFGSETGIDLMGEESGVIPTPEWKARVFGPEDPWRIGNTYHTVIGQYGFQVTALQAVRYTAAIANGGKLLKPQLLASSTPEFMQLDIADEHLQVARDGMRLAVTSARSDATVKSLYIAGIKIAAKTGTAQLGVRNEYMNSWSVGYWPADEPKYAYAVVLERARAGTASGAAPGLVPFFQWLVEQKPQYVK